MWTQKTEGVSSSEWPNYRRDVMENRNSSPICVSRGQQTLAEGACRDGHARGWQRSAWDLGDPMSCPTRGTENAEATHLLGSACYPVL